MTRVGSWKIFLSLAGNGNTYPNLRERKIVDISSTQEWFSWQFQWRDRLVTLDHFPLKKKTVKMKKHVESSSPPRFFSGKHPLFQGVIWVEVMQQTLTNWALMNVPFQGASNACLVLSVAPNRMVKVQHRTGFKHFNSCFHVTNFGKNLHNSNPRVMKNAISIVCIHMILYIYIYMIHVNSK